MHSHQFKKKKRFDGALQWSIKDWISVLGQRRRTKEKVSILIELQDTVLLPKDLPSTSTTSGMSLKKLSIIRSGLIPGGQSLRRGRQPVSFTIVNPMEDENCVEEIHAT